MNLFCPSNWKSVFAPCKAFTEFCKSTYTDSHHNSVYKTANTKVNKCTKACTLCETPLIHPCRAMMLLTEIARGIFPVLGAVFPAFTASSCSVNLSTFSASFSNSCCVLSCADFAWVSCVAWAADIDSRRSNFWFKARVVVPSIDAILGVNRVLFKPLVRETPSKEKQAPVESICDRCNVQTLPARLNFNTIGSTCYSQDKSHGAGSKCILVSTNIRRIRARASREYIFCVYIRFW